MKNLIAIAVFLMSAAAFAQDSAWHSSADKDIAGAVTNTAIAYGDSNGVDFVVRGGHKCEVYLSANDFIFSDRATVNVKFNNGPVQQFYVTRGDGSDSLFFTNPLAVMRAIKNNGGYMTVEYSPYEKTPSMTKFGVWNLPTELLARIKETGGVRSTPRSRAESIRESEAEDRKSEAEAQSWRTQGGCEGDGFIWTGGGCHASTK